MRLLSESEMENVTGGNPIGPIFNYLLRRGLASAGGNAASAQRAATAATIGANSLTSSSPQGGPSGGGSSSGSGGYIKGDFGPFLNGSRLT